MPTLDEMKELVNAHAALEDDPMETAIWIKQDHSDAWLVEVIPSMEDDRHPERPIHFNAGRSFRHPLYLYGLNRTDLEAVLHGDLELASAVAAGTVLYGQEIGAEIISLAREIMKHGNAQAS